MNGPRKESDTVQVILKGNYTVRRKCRAMLWMFVSPHYSYDKNLVPKAMVLRGRILGRP